MATCYEDYEDLISTFYFKVINNHRRKPFLSDKFTRTCLEKKRQHSFSPMNSAYKKSQDDSRSVSARSKSSLNRSYRTIKQKPLKSINSNYLYLGDTFKQAFCFSFLQYLIDKQNLQVFNMVETKVKLFMNTKDKLSSQQKSQLDKGSNQWRKITQQKSHKSKVRWEKLLGECLNKLGQSFVNILIKSILSMGPNASPEIEHSQEWLAKISNQLKLSIIYLEYKDNVQVSKIKQGHYQQKIIICNLISDEKYAVFDQLPNEGENSETSTTRKSSNYLGMQTEKKERTSSATKINQAETIKTTKKVLRIVQNLLKDYHDSQAKIDRLEVFQEEISKDAKIKKILESRKRKQ